MLITLEQAVALVQELEPDIARQGGHLSLTGSVLFSGESKKDLDLVVYSHDLANPYREKDILRIFKLKFPNIQVLSSNNKAPACNEPTEKSELDLLFDEVTTNSPNSRYRFDKEVRVIYTNTPDIPRIDLFLF